MLGRRAYPILHQTRTLSNIARAASSVQDWKRIGKSRNAIASIGVAGFLVGAWYLTPRQTKRGHLAPPLSSASSPTTSGLDFGDPNLSTLDIDRQVSVCESTLLPPSFSSVVRIDLDYLDSNNPIEDKSFTGALSKRGLVVGVLDGHWAPSTVNVVQKYLPFYLKKYLSKASAGNDKAIGQALSDAFEDLDRDLLTAVVKAVPGFLQMSPAAIKALPADIKTKGQEAAFIGLQGSCGLVAYIEGKTLHVAHAGDSRAVLGKRTHDGSWKPVRLTADHTPRNPDESYRLRSEHPGEEKTVAFERKGEEGYPRVLGGMACSRAFGDGRFKWTHNIQERVTALLDGHPLARRYREFSLCKTPPYMTAKPDLSSRQLSDEDYFVVLGSDGIFDNLSDEEVVGAVGTFLDGRGHFLETGVESKANLEVRDSNAGTHLVRTALANGYGIEGQSRMLSLDVKVRRNYRDDMTAAVVFLQPAKSLLKKKEQTKSIRVIETIESESSFESLAQ
ncbi:hypothetical protein HDU97_002279 [Phlyctochytrium planicorne]|nr:hypothetical protein HDU97_002279 [Phlyctochytrium planicorne]